MTVVALLPLEEHEARALTDQVKADAVALWSKLLALYEGGAHAALGYSSWGAYCQAEFDMGRSRSYQLLEAARVVGELPQSTTVDSPNEAQARELAPLKDEPEAMAEVWEEASSDGAPTAKDIRAAVLARRPGPLSTRVAEWNRRLWDVKCLLDGGPEEFAPRTDKERESLLLTVEWLESMTSTVKEILDEQA